MADRIPASLAQADDERAHRRCQRGEHLGRVLLAALLLAGALGLLGGSGPLAERTFTSTPERSTIQATTIETRQPHSRSQ